MFHLIITVIAIALSGFLSLIAVNYLPSWSPAAAQVSTQVQTAFPLLEQAYGVLTRTADGEAPATLAHPDGGFVSQFMPLLKFAPAAPAGYRWSYGQHPSDGSHYAGLHFFCLEPIAPTIPEGVSRGITRGVSIFSKSQVFLNTNCGATSSVSDWSAKAPAATYFVTYVPGIAR